MKLYIKNMVCDRCVIAVKNAIRELQNTPSSVIMGEIDFFDKTLNKNDINQIKLVIEPLGFELISNKKQTIIEKIKTSLISLTHHNHDIDKIKLSDHISTELNQDYPSLSLLFSSIEGMTIEKYFIHLKVERIKELLVYDELSLTDISYRLGYSSQAHLSSQFKQITGMTPTTFKKLKDNKQRLPLDKI